MGRWRSAWSAGVFRLAGSRAARRRAGPRAGDLLDDAITADAAAIDGSPRGRLGAGRCGRPLALAVREGSRSVTVEQQVAAARP